MTYLLHLTPRPTGAPAAIELTAKPAIGELLRLRDVGDYRITDVVHDVSVDQHAHTSASVEIRAVRWEPDTKNDEAPR